MYKDLKLELNFLVTELKKLELKTLTLINCDNWLKDFLNNYFKDLELVCYNIDEIEVLKVKDNNLIIQLNNLSANDYEKIEKIIANSNLSILLSTKKSISEITSTNNTLWETLLLKYSTKEKASFLLNELSGLGIVYPKKAIKKVFPDFNLAKIQFNEKVPMNSKIYEDNITLFKYCFETLDINYTESFNELKTASTNIIFVPFSNYEFTTYAFDYSYLLVQFEQIAYINNIKEAIKHDRYKNYIQLMKNALFIWDYAQINIDYLKDLGINNICLLPFGFHEKMKVLNHEVKKDIDILFYGSLNDRRMKIIKDLQKLGLKVKVLYNVYGSERNRFIERAKIIININWNEQTILPEHRLSFLLNNECFIISEKPASEIPKSYQEGIVFCTYEELVTYCLFYLKPENLANTRVLAHKGYDNFSKNKMVDNLKRSLKAFY
jgi:hypothetical protein